MCIFHTFRLNSPYSLVHSTNTQCAHTYTMPTAKETLSLQTYSTVKRDDDKQSVPQMEEEVNTELISVAAYAYFFHPHSFNLKFKFFTNFLSSCGMVSVVVFSLILFVTSFIN